jgi:putative glutamine amidotransferase
MRPLIGITCQRIDAASAPPRLGVNRAYVVSVEAAGGLPVLIPPMDDTDELESLLDRLDGIVFTGGADIDPAHYGQANQAAEGIDPARDAVEVALARAAARRGVPVLAICRGQQLVNVALGGTLVQHVESHRQDAPREAPTHDVDIVAPGSVLARSAETSRISVNSLHHQVVDQVAPGLEVTALSADGDRWIEGIESPDGSIVGVQCHPEHLAPATGWAARLFEHLVEGARAFRQASAPASAAR